MPPSDRAAGKIVFVGNIPYGLTEEQITDIFSSAGPVSSFRLVYDRETGRPKGFGFAEYSDAETAASAVRNLDNYEIMNRKLRVDFSHEGAGPPDDYAPAAGPSSSAGLPPLPAGVDIPPGLSAPDAISGTLKSLPPQQLLDILTQMKALVTSDPNKATELLRAAPQLSYAIFQALLLMNLVQPAVITQVLDQSAGGYQQQPPAPAPAAAPTPVMPAAPTPVAGMGMAGMDPQRQALIQQVISLTEQQIAALPVEQQQQIMLLKAQLTQGGAGMPGFG